MLSLLFIPYFHFVFYFSSPSVLRSRASSGPGFIGETGGVRCRSLTAINSSFDEDEGYQDYGNLEFEF